MRKNISLSQQVEERAKAIIEARGFDGLSDLLAALIREEYERRQPPTLQETHTAYKTEADISPERKAELLRQAGEHLQADLEQAKEPPKKRQKPGPRK
jgi:hypothetical protein